MIGLDNVRRDTAGLMTLPSLELWSPNILPESTETALDGIGNIIKYKITPDPSAILSLKGDNVHSSRYAKTAWLGYYRTWLSAKETSHLGLPLSRHGLHVQLSPRAETLWLHCTEYIAV